MIPIPPGHREIVARIFPTFSLLVTASTEDTSKFFAYAEDSYNHVTFSYEPEETEVFGQTLQLIVGQAGSLIALAKQRMIDELMDSCGGPNGNTVH